MVVGGFEGEQGEDEAEGKGAGVAHKDFGGWEVEDEKAEEGANEKKRQCADEDLAACNGGGEKNGGDDNGDTCGGAIHIVEEVEDIDNEDEPEGADEGGEELILDEKLDADIGERCGDDSDGQLDSEFQERAEVNFIVDESECKESGDAANYDNELRGFFEEAD